MLRPELLRGEVRTTRAPFVAVLLDEELDDIDQLVSGIVSRRVGVYGVGVIFIILKTHF